MIFGLGVRDNETDRKTHRILGYWDIAQSLKNTPMPHPLPHPPLAQIQRIFIAALFMRAPNWKPRKGPSVKGELT